MIARLHRHEQRRIGALAAEQRGRRDRAPWRGPRSPSAASRGSHAPTVEFPVALRNFCARLPPHHGQEQGRRYPHVPRDSPAGSPSACTSSPACRAALDKGATTILKDNISWHFPFPGANTTPWQLEGTIRALRGAGFDDLVCVQNKTVVTNAFKGEDLNHYVPIFKQVRHPGPLQLQARGHDAGRSTGPRRRCTSSTTIFPEGIQHPRLLLRQEHRPPADGEVPHLHHDHRRDEERVRRAAQHPAPLHALVDPRTLVDLLAIQKEIHAGPVRGDGRHHRRRRPRAAHDAPGDQGRTCWRRRIRWRSTRSRPR